MVVALVTVTGPNDPEVAPPTDISGPNRASVEPCTKLLYVPLIVTVKVWPMLPEFWLIWLMAAGGLIVCIR